MSHFDSEAMAAIARRLARIRRSPAARDLKLVFPFVGIALAAVGVFAFVHLLAYGLDTIGPLPTVIAAWVPVALIAGICIGTTLDRAGRGPRP